MLVGKLGATPNLLMTSRNRNFRLFPGDQSNVHLGELWLAPHFPPLYCEQFLES